MVWKILTSLITIITTIAAISWLNVYLSMVKAELMVNQLEDSNVIPATVRWVNGDIAAILIIIFATSILFAIWRKSFTKKEEK